VAKKRKHKAKKRKKKSLSGRVVRFFFLAVWIGFRSIGSAVWIGIQWIARKIHLISKKSLMKSSKSLRERKLAARQPKTIAQIRKFKLVKKLKGTIEAFQHQIYSKHSVIGIILGARGTGKSAIGMFLLENFKARSEKKCYAMGFKRSTVPGWIGIVEGIDEIENNSVLLVDEGGIEFSSRSSMSGANKLLSEILLVARHKDLSVLFITQNSSNLEVNAIRQADFLLLKASSLLQRDFERKKIRDIYTEVHDDFEKMKEVEGLVYIYSDKFRGFATNPLPLFWSDKVSKGYSRK
jgi:hypothetical protein